MAKEHGAIIDLLQYLRVNYDGAVTLEVMGLVSELGVKTVHDIAQRDRSYLVGFGVTPSTLHALEETLAAEYDLTLGTMSQEGHYVTDNGTYLTVNGRDIIFSTDSRGLSKERLTALYEGHREGLSIKEIAKLPAVHSTYPTVKKYLGLAGLVEPATKTTKRKRAGGAPPREEFSGVGHDFIAATIAEYVK